MVNPLRDGWGYDFATRRPLDFRKPEESVRQNYERTLHFDYGYPLEHMDIEVSILRGEARRKGNLRDAADIVIYHTGREGLRNQFSDILGIVETKRPIRKDGLAQLMSYMTASSAQWGVWTNGSDIEYVYRDPVSGEPRTEYIFDIPRFGESLKDMGRLTKADLIPAQPHSLKPIFNRILKRLYGNTNISRREKLGSEMIRLIFAKIWDERFDVENVPAFRVGFNEDPEVVRSRIISLFEKVKANLVEDGVFDASEAITLDPKSVAWVVGQLERYSLLHTDKDVVGDAFEVFAESKFVGEKGEFFTPREVVQTAVDLVDPQPGQRILDPACGSGGFLIYALEHVWHRMDDLPQYRGSPRIEHEREEVARRCFFGIDKETDLVKIAKAYMAIAGDGRGGIVHENTLHAALDYEGRARDLFTSNGEFRQFDIIFTNPPFGADADAKVLKEEAAQFVLGHRWQKTKEGWTQTNVAQKTEPQILFIERCMDMLVTGGTLAIVLPETLFHAPNYGYIRQFMMRGNNVKAIIDLPHNTFRPHNNAKTCLIILQKAVPQQDHIVMAVAEEMGHDHGGRPLYRFDKTTQKPTDEIWDDLKIIREELADPYDSTNHYTFVVNAADVLNSVYVPRYYWPQAKHLADLEGVTPVSLRELLDAGIVRAWNGHGSPRAEYKGRGEIPYIRVSDIMNWDLYRNPTSGVPRHVYERVKGNNGVDLEPHDIIFVRRGSYRIGTVAMASPHDDELLLTNELVVLRVAQPDNAYGITPYYLLYLLSHQATQRQIQQKVLYDTTLPNIGDRWKELLLPVLDDREERALISQRVQSVMTSKWSALAEIRSLRREYGDITT